MQNSIAVRTAERGLSPSRDVCTWELFSPLNVALSICNIGIGTFCIKLMPVSPRYLQNVAAPYLLVHSKCRTPLWPLGLLGASTCGVPQWWMGRSSKLHSNKNRSFSLGLSGPRVSWCLISLSRSSLCINMRVPVEWS